ncbi:hypothetical protein GCM10010446_61140 [Streptomyces enissocaesilis]|uniref:Xaa-Pro dipeptidyl-peptidase C-terminal domain-containing protein n=1 Tax=Streptomyces enissocaesilis TaxID=332589 RepID=A0ABP6K798_9ACTN
MAKGWLKASHRKLDPERSTEYAPKHTHLTADHAPPAAGEIVPVEIELIPHTAVVREGHRIGIDIQPYDGQGHGTHHAYDPSYHTGATNTVPTGPNTSDTYNCRSFPADSLVDTSRTVPAESGRAAHCPTRRWHHGR